MTITFCKTCHKEVYRIKQEGEKVEVLQNGRPLFTFNDKSHIDITLNCPSGHPVPLNIGV